ncbi:hypothetical protein [Dyadobacter psychrophilus]|uniref:ABC-2 type transport system permease protein n=1 Tax=Dyadobacter psychrophilus TaxID=651661 RepID=A0A1T5BZI5_9BACT|nr:hypothetical protein [Dyadobacter psychrophilus]SKB52546.1 hypothetical protein SAMN05660293_00754 [Dyadobacter psychrophilus]
MNQTFNIHRFALVIKLDFSERAKNYLMIAAILLVLLLSMMLPITTSNKPVGFYEALHYMALFVVMIFATSLYTGSAMTHYTAFPTSISSLMLPASNLEKFLSALFFNLVFIVPFLILFFQLHYRTIDVANAQFPANSYKYPYIKPDLAVYFCFTYFMLHSIVFLGSIYFSKRSYVKTAAFIIIAVTVVFTIHIVLAGYLAHYPSHINTLPLAGWEIWYFEGQNIASGVNELHVIHSLTNYRVIQGFTALFILSFWYMAYLRLKEKEV